MEFKGFCRNSLISDCQHYCIGQLSSCWIKVPNTHNLTEEMFYFVLNFKRISPWSIDSLLWASAEQNIMGDTDSVTQLFTSWYWGSRGKGNSAREKGTSIIGSMVTNLSPTANDYSFPFNRPLRYELRYSSTNWLREAVWAEFTPVGPSFKMKLHGGTQNVQLLG